MRGKIFFVNNFLTCIGEKRGKRKTVKHVKMQKRNINTQECLKMKSKYIEKNKKYWGPEFARLANCTYQKEHDEMAAMGCYTMLYHIADNFQDGAFREEILKMAGVEPEKEPAGKKPKSF